MTYFLYITEANGWYETLAIMIKLKLMNDHNNQNKIYISDVNFSSLNSENNKNTAWKAVALYTFILTIVAIAYLHAIASANFLIISDRTIIPNDASNYNS